jgi:hypothetical protein
MQKREHLKKLKREKLEAHRWLPSLLNMNKEKIEKEHLIESRLMKLKEEGFYPFDIEDPTILEHLKKHPVFGAKHILDLFELRDVLLAIVTWKTGNIRIFTRIFNIRDYMTRGRRWRTQLAGDVMDAWFKNHKFRYLQNSFKPEVESYTEELKLRLARFLADFTVEQNISHCEMCGAFYLRFDSRYKTKRMREYWELTARQKKGWMKWRNDYRSNIEAEKSTFFGWYENTHPGEFGKMKSYGLLRIKKEKTYPIP